MRLKLYARSCLTLQQNRRRVSRGLPHPVYQGRLRLRANLREGTFLKRVAMMQDVIDDQRRQLKEEMRTVLEAMSAGAVARALLKEMLRTAGDVLKDPGHLPALAKAEEAARLYLEAWEATHDSAR